MKKTIKLLLAILTTSHFTYATTTTVDVQHKGTFHHECFYIPSKTTKKPHWKVNEIDEETLLTWLKSENFCGKVGEVVTFSTITNDKPLTAKKYSFIGIGDTTQNKRHTLENIRKATGTLVKNQNGTNKNITIHCPQHLKDIQESEIISTIALSSHLAHYNYDGYKTKKPSSKLTVTIVPQADSQYSEEVNEANVIGKFVNIARFWGDCPANILTPNRLAIDAQNLAETYGCTCTVFGESIAEELGMGGFIAVGKGSTSQMQFITVEYKCEDPNAPTVALVGKGVVYDSGGLDLKPARGMYGMKYDMCGGAAALAVTLACAQLKLNVNVVAVVPAVENKPSANSYRSRDIITFMNGKTAEIGNTDAEGRIILADGLCYAEKYYQPKVIVDIATLTGACVVGLGHHYSGVMSKHDWLAESLVNAGLQAGEGMWRLPFPDDYKPALHSDFADVHSTGSPRYSAGSITAGLFLSNFVEKTPWVHLDIAGPSHGMPGVSYLSEKFATGASIRTLIEFIKNFKKYTSHDQPQALLTTEELVTLSNLLNI